MINKMKDHFRNSIFFFSASRGAGAQSVTVKTDWSWFRSPLEEIKYLFNFIFLFLRSDVEAKRGVEFCHSARNSSRIRRKVGNGVSFTLGSFCLPCCCGIQRKDGLQMIEKSKSKRTSLKKYSCPQLYLFSPLLWKLVKKIK